MRNLRIKFGFEATLNFFSVEVNFLRSERENLGNNLSLLLIFKFPSATEIDEICRGVLVPPRS